MNEPYTTRRDAVRLLGWSLLLFALSLALFSRHNTFAYFYHPDEPGKVEQVLDGKWNFHHPMLLLGATRAAVETAGVEKREQPVVEAGRWVSAGFMALAVVALSLLAFAWRGWDAAFAAGLTLALHHQLYELAHYLKEDSALLAGLSLSFLMLLAVWWRPTPWRVALLGAACGLAISGKYLGIVAVALAVPVLWKAAPTHAGRRALIFTLTLAATLLAVNWPMLEGAATFRESFGREVELVAKGQGGLTRRVPHAQYWNVFIDNTTPVIWALLGLFLYARWQERRQLRLPEWLLIAFPIGFALALSFSPKSNDRYFLPATALFTLFAALGVRDFARLFPRGPRRFWATLGAAAALVLGQLPSFWKYERAFQHDDTAELIEWLNTKVPATAVIARDNRIQLPDPQRKKHASRLGVVPQRVVNRNAAGKPVRFAADLGTVDELRAMGITHVAVSESDYGRFFLQGLRPQEKERAEFERRKAFYEQLMREEDLAFERDRGTVIYLHPGIRVYRLRPEF